VSACGDTCTVTQALALAGRSRSRASPRRLALPQRGRLGGALPGRLVSWERPHRTPPSPLDDALRLRVDNARVVPLQVLEEEIGVDIELLEGASLALRAVSLAKAEALDLQTAGRLHDPQHSPGARHKAAASPFAPGPTRKPPRLHARGPPRPALSLGAKVRPPRLKGDLSIGRPSASP
jgi:hypothetical protein